jgi:hypothetical protein
MTVGGHPNMGEGDAVLNWRYQSSDFRMPDPHDKYRLMCSGKHTNFSNPGKQLVKREWDKIEGWLKFEETRLGRSL